MILPDTLAHLNGHMVITETYSIFVAADRNDPYLAAAKESLEHLPYNKDPDYLGVLRFEVPDKLFNYTPGEHQSLNTEEVTKLIELLTQVRGNPHLWKL